MKLYQSPGIQVKTSMLLRMGTASGGAVSISSNQGLAGFALFDNLKTGNHNYAGINE